MKVLNDRVLQSKQDKESNPQQNSPMASERPNPRIAFELSCCFRDGFLADNETDTHTLPNPAPDPAPKIIKYKKWMFH